MLEAPTRVFPFEIWEIFKNTYFEEHLRTAASDVQDFGILPSRCIPMQGLNARILKSAQFV